jgi:hypothetical protein
MPIIGWLTSIEYGPTGSAGLLYRHASQHRVQLSQRDCVWSIKLMAGTNGFMVNFCHCELFYGE